MTNFYPDFYQFVPLIPVVSLAAAYAYSAMINATLKLDWIPVTTFVLVSIGAYVIFFYRNPNATVYLPRPYAELWATVYVLYVVAFLVLSLFLSHHA